MKEACEALGVSRQAHWKHRSQAERAGQDDEMILNEARRLRVLHPRMGGKKLYLLIKPECMGRDRFQALLAISGMLVSMRRNIARTTFGVGASRYANLMEGLVIDGIDQVWVTDITYFFIGGDCYYVVLVMDVYSRKLLGYSVEAHMRAESCLAALQMAFKARGRKDYGGSLIHHSDRGGQYASDLYTGALEVRGVRISMCLTVYENTHMERLNGTIKGEYLTPYAPTDLRDLKRKLAKAHGLYNDHRPHESLNFLAPTAFEESLASIPPAERTKLSLYVDPATKVRNKFRNQLTLFDA